MYIQNYNIFRQPICTGTSVLGLKFENGVIICADNLASYGSMARFRGVPRVMKVNKNIAVGVGGDYADYQYLQRIIEQKMYYHSVPSFSLFCNKNKLTN